MWRSEEVIPSMLKGEIFGHLALSVWLVAVKCVGIAVNIHAGRSSWMSTRVSMIAVDASIDVIGVSSSGGVLWLL